MAPVQVLQAIDKVLQILLAELRTIGRGDGAFAVGPVAVAVRSRT